MQALVTPQSPVRAVLKTAKMPLEVMDRVREVFNVHEFGVGENRLNRGFWDRGPIATVCLFDAAHLLSKPVRSEAVADHLRTQPMNWPRILGKAYHMALDPHEYRMTRDNFSDFKLLVDEFRERTGNRLAEYDVFSKWCMREFYKGLIG